MNPAGSSTPPRRRRSFSPKFLFRKSRRSSGPPEPPSDSLNVPAASDDNKSNGKERSTAKAKRVPRPLSILSEGEEDGGFNVQSIVVTPSDTAPAASVALPSSPLSHRQSPTPESRHRARSSHLSEPSEASGRSSLVSSDFSNSEERLQTAAASQHSGLIRPSTADVATHLRAGNGQAFSRHSPRMQSVGHPAGRDLSPASRSRSLRSSRRHRPRNIEEALGSKDMMRMIASNNSKRRCLKFRAALSRAIRNHTRTKEHFGLEDIKALMNELDVKEDLIDPIAKDILETCGKDDHIHALELASALMEREDRILGIDKADAHAEAMDGRSGSLAGLFSPELAEARRKLKTAQETTQKMQEDHANEVAMLKEKIAVLEKREENRRRHVSSRRTSTASVSSDHAAVGSPFTETKASPAPALRDCVTQTSNRNLLQDASSLHSAAKHMDASCGPDDAPQRDDDGDDNDVGNSQQLQPVLSPELIASLRDDRICQLESQLKLLRHAFEKEVLSAEGLASALPSELEELKEKDAKVQELQTTVDALRARNRHLEQAMARQNDAYAAQIAVQQQQQQQLQPKTTGDMQELMENARRQLQLQRELVDQLLSDLEASKMDLASHISDNTRLIVERDELQRRLQSMESRRPRAARLQRRYQAIVAAYDQGLADVSNHFLQTLEAIADEISGQKLEAATEEMKSTLLDHLQSLHHALDEENQRHARKERAAAATRVSSSAPKDANAGVAARSSSASGKKAGTDVSRHGTTASAVPEGREVDAHRTPPHGDSDDEDGSTATANAKSTLELLRIGDDGDDGDDDEEYGEENGRSDLSRSSHTNNGSMEPNFSRMSWDMTGTSLHADDEEDDALNSAPRLYEEDTEHSSNNSSRRAHEHVADISGFGVDDDHDLDPADDAQPGYDRIATWAQHVHAAHEEGGVGSGHTAAPHAATTVVREGDRTHRSPAISVSEEASASHPSTSRMHGAVPTKTSTGDFVYPPPANAVRSRLFSKPQPRSSHDENQGHVVEGGEAKQQETNEVLESQEQDQTEQQQKIQPQQQQQQQQRQPQVGYVARAAASGGGRGLRLENGAACDDNDGSDDGSWYKQRPHHGDCNGQQVRSGVENAGEHEREDSAGGGGRGFKTTGACASGNAIALKNGYSTGVSMTTATDADTETPVGTQHQLRVSELKRESCQQRTSESDASVDSIQMPPSSCDSRTSSHDYRQGVMSPGPRGTSRRSSVRLEVDLDRFAEGGINAAVAVIESPKSPVRGFFADQLRARPKAKGTAGASHKAQDEKQKMSTDNVTEPDRFIQQAKARVNRYASLRSRGGVRLRTQQRGKFVRQSLRDRGRGNTVSPSSFAGHATAQATAAQTPAIATSLPTSPAAARRHVPGRTQSQRTPSQRAAPGELTRPRTQSTRKLAAV